jgi:hypothetical protein
MTRFLAAVVALVALVALPAAAQAHKKKHRDTEVRLLAINDFHGNLQPPSGSSGRISTGPAPTVDAGGAEYLATHLRMKERTNRNTLIVSAGDLIGASPLLSALFHDEPTIEAMNMIGLDVTSVGNHEFDEGPAELRRLKRGGCHPIDGCADGTPYGDVAETLHLDRRRVGRRIERLDQDVFKLCPPALQILWRQDKDGFTTSEYRPLHLGEVTDQAEQRQRDYGQDGERERAGHMPEPALVGSDASGAFPRIAVQPSHE